VKNKRGRSLPVRPPGVEKTSRLGSSGGQVWTAWWQERQDEVEDGFLVEPQNQGSAGTSWEPSHEWCLAEATSSSRALWCLNRKPLGYSAEPQSRGRGPGVAVRPKPA
jgi:hypothetical protein